MNLKNEYNYRISISNNESFAYISERQKVIRTIDELVGNGNKNDEVAFFESTKNTTRKKIIIENIIGDFLSIAEINNDKHTQFDSKFVYWLNFNDNNDNLIKTKTYEEYRKKIENINILDAEFPVILYNDWFKNPIFLPEKIINNFAKENAIDIWRMVYRIVIKSNGLMNIDLGEFNVLCSMYNVSIHCHIKDFTNRINPFKTDTVLNSNLTYIYTCNNSKEIIFSLLHYCISNKLYLKKCKLCNKYFIPQKAQENFCNRKFNYVNWNNTFKEYESCKIARKMICQTLKARAKKIENLLKSRVDRNGCPITSEMSEEEKKYIYNTFPDNRAKKNYEDAIKEFKSIIKKEPSIDNIKKLEKYLYIECEKYYKRYERSKDNGNIQK